MPIIKRAKVQKRSPDDAARAESETDVETSRSMNVDSDVEHGASTAPRAVTSVEGPAPATFRVDIERGGETDAGDVERGPAKLTAPGQCFPIESTYRP